MTYLSASPSLFSEVLTAEHIEYALPTPTSPHTPAYHHIQHFLPDGIPGACSTHIEHADSSSYSSSSASAASETTISFFDSTPSRREHNTMSPTTTAPSSPSTSTSPSTSPRPHLRLRFAGDLPIPPRPSSTYSPPAPAASASTTPATDSMSTSPNASHTRPRLHRNRIASPYPFVAGAVCGRGTPDALADESRPHLGSRRSDGEGEEVLLSSHGHTMTATVARTAFVDREEVWDESGFWGEEEEEE